VTGSLREPAASPEPFISVAQVAAHLGLPKSWVYKQVAARAIPFYKLGHYVCFRLSEVEEWLESRRVEPVHG
jgi:excisionase family DNA binding protein